jgi:hypothetical protein
MSAWDVFALLAGAKAKEVRPMRIKLFGAITLVCTLLAGGAMACPVGEAPPPVQRPRPVQNVSLRVSELLEQASRMDQGAMQREQTATALEQDADNLANRARILRNQANLVNVSARGDLMAVADELSMRASNERMRASNERATASDLRAQARSLRAQAVALQGGGGGWRKGPVRDFSVPSTSTPSSSQATTNI